METTSEPARTTTLNALRTQVAPRIESLPRVQAGFDNLQGFELAQRAAKALAASTIVPKDYHGNVANCIVALEMAQRINASPLMVMQHLNIIRGRPSWSAAFLIATFNQCGRFTSIRYDWQGTTGRDDWGCRAHAGEKGTQTRITSPLVTIGIAKREGWYDRDGSKWKTTPELMLMYRAASWLVRTHAPELSMGLPSAEESGDVIDVTPTSPAAAPPPTPAAAPDWAEMLSAAESLDELEATHAACLEATGGVWSDECDLAYTSRKEQLGEQEGKQFELK